MGESRLARSRSGLRRPRRLRQGRRGVVAVVGTLLALLVFFALFGVFLTQYLPLWMTDNESQLSNEAQGSLAALKNGIDLQYALGTIPILSVPFTISSASVPLLAQPTEGTLSYLTGCPSGFYPGNGTPVVPGSCSYARITYTVGGGAVRNNPYVGSAPSNILTFSLPNRYYTPITYYLEEDAVEASQGGGHQLMVLPPPINVSKTDGNVTVTSSLVDLLGNASTYTGLGSKDVTSHLVSSSRITSTDRFLNGPTCATNLSSCVAMSFNVTITLGVHSVCAWYNYLANVTVGSGASSTVAGSWGSGAPSSTVCTASTTQTYDITLTLLNVNYATTFVAQAQLGFNAGGL